jgi:hypothetical protein
MNLWKGVLSSSGMEETYPVKQIDSVWLEMEVEVGATTDELKDNNAVAEHVCLLCQLSPHCVFWGKITSVKAMQFSQSTIL